MGLHRNMYFIQPYHVRIHQIKKFLEMTAGRKIFL